MAGPLTKTEQVLKVLKAGGKATVGRGAGGIATLRDKHGVEVDAWQNAIKAAARIHDAATKPSKQHSMQVLNLALRIADNTARSDIECYAFWKEHGHRSLYDISQAPEDPKATPAEQAECIRKAQDAVRYIELRADVFPWRLVRDPSFPNIVHFEDKP